MDGFHPLVVAAVDQLTDDAIAITFEVPPDLREVFAFRPGQHLTLRQVLDGVELRRTYSVCAPTSGPLRVAVKALDGGVFSTWACKELLAGDVLDVLPPVGSFGPALSSVRRRRYGLVAAGSGITPILSIAATALEVEPESEVVLLFGNRTSRDVMFLDELSDLKDRYPQRVQLVWVMSREEQESELLSGRLDRERLGRILDAMVPVEDIDEWYLCGPFGLVTEARTLLLERGATQVHVELFHADAPPPRVARDDDAQGATVIAMLHGRSSTVTMERGTSVLDAVLQVRADAPYACKGGVCGTCRARVLEGKVEMDVNWALEPDEVAAGVVLTCQSHPVTDQVRLAFL